MADFKNDFSWSASRARLFRTCPRAYYYNYYGYWNGWNYRADDKTKLTYKLKKLQSLALWAGSTVHDILEDVLKMQKAIGTGASEPERMEIFYQLKHLHSLHHSETAEYGDERKKEAEEESLAFERAMQEVKENKTPTLTTALLRAMARLKLRRGFKESLSQKKRHDAKKLYLFEHFYEEGIDKEKAEKTSNKIYTALDAFCKSKEVAEMLQMPPGNWRSVDELNKYSLKNIFSKPDDPDKYFYNDIPVWCAIDFAYVDHSGDLWIIDWKTGKENSEELRLQLASYAIYAQQEWGFPLEKIHLCGVYLNDNARVSRYEVSLEDVEEVRSGIADSCRNMLDLLDDQVDNRATESKFIPTPDDFKCRYCNFKKVCPNAMI